MNLRWEASHIAGPVVPWQATPGPYIDAYVMNILLTIIPDYSWQQRISSDFYQQMKFDFYYFQTLNSLPI